MNSAMRAVTKSAYATFHAPPRRCEWIRDRLTCEGAGMYMGAAAGSRGLDLFRAGTAGCCCCSSCGSCIVAPGLRYGRDFGIPPDNGFHVGEGGPLLGGNRAAGELHRENGRRAFGVGHHPGAQHLEELRV